MTRTITWVLAAVGVIVAIVAVFASRRQPEIPPPARVPPVSPYESSIAASGLVEAQSRNVEIAPPENGLLREVLVEVGDPVKAGTPVLRMDSRILQAQLEEAKAAVEVASSELSMLENKPRPERVAVLEQTLAAAEARLEDAKSNFERVRRASENDAARPQELTTAKFLLEARQAERDQASAELAMEKAGTWEPDLAVARAQRDSAAARVRSLDSQIDRFTVRSPIDGTVLKRSNEPGEYVSAATTVPLVIGDVSTLRVRARVDEADTPFLRQGAKAMARLRGLGSSEIPLRMLRIEPLAMPKTDLTNMPSERVDTRVVEVLFEVEPVEGLTLYPGVLVDVFIEASKPVAVR
ncbi:MAG: HlyD family efflux transporter periplasmic adaptor subunit [Phycisphaerae bacterium]|nr:HlyD family efflux transporter periplasmic adaptor subunit [Phycisphaerae bacterium]